MNKLLTNIGFVITAIYCLILLVLLKGRFYQIYEMPLNELGDFLAGIFGPIAFFWLILGFLQQGQELKQSTKALELQAKELNNSVTQQKELVEISRKQVEADLDALARERQKEKELSQPKFIFTGVGGTHHAGGSSRYSTTIKNVGNAINNINLSFNIEMKFFNRPIVNFWDRNEGFRIEFEYIDYTSAEEAIFTISYTDILGVPGQKEFTFSRIEEDQYPSIKILPKEANTDR